MLPSKGSSSHSPSGVEDHRRRVADSNPGLRSPGCSAKEELFINIHTKDRNSVYATDGRIVHGIFSDFHPRLRSPGCSAKEELFIKIHIKGRNSVYATDGRIVHSVFSHFTKSHRRGISWKLSRGLDHSIPTQPILCAPGLPCSSLTPPMLRIPACTKIL